MQEELPRPLAVLPDTPNTPDTPQPPSLKGSALSITLVYAAIAGTWIYASDHWVSHFATTADETMRLSVWKGAAFVVVTALLLFGLMVRVFGRLEAANQLLVRHEAEIARFNRLYAALSEINQASLWSTDRDALFQQVCQALVEHGGLKMAWIGQASDPPGMLTPAAVFGDDQNYLGTIQVSTVGAPDSRFAAAIAFHKGRPLVRNQLLTDPDTAQWAELFRQQGFAASAAFPIRQGDEVGAVLSVYSGTPGFFQHREVGLLKRAATNLAYAVDNLRREQRRQAAEAQAHLERELSRAMLESMPGIIFIYNRAGKMLRWNHTLEAETGYSAADIAGMHPRDFFAEEGRGRVDAAIDAIFAGALSNVEARVRARDGQITLYMVTSHRVEINGEPCVLGQGVKLAPDIARDTRSTIQDQAV